MASSSYVELHYPLGKANLYAAFLLRGLELAKPGGLSAMLTMRNWMFLKQYSELRKNLLSFFSLRLIHDLSSGAFEEISGDVVSVASSIITRLSDVLSPSIALKVFNDEALTSVGETLRKRAATIAQEGLHRFQAVDLKVVPEWPLVYWWTYEFLEAYRSSPKLIDYCPPKKGMTTSDNTRFVINAWETSFAQCGTWAPYIMGANGMRWIDMSEKAIRWKSYGLEVKLFNESLYRSYTRSIQNETFYFKLGVAYSTIGANFSARIHRKPSVIDTGGSSMYPISLGELTCLLNSKATKYVLSSINPTVNYKNVDIARVPYFPVPGCDAIWKQVESAGSLESIRREFLSEFYSPGPSPWRHSQEWAQQAVDRPEGAPLPDYTEVLDPEPPTDHQSFALGVALGRFAPVDEQGQPTTSNPAGILDPCSAELSHALPAGILFLDGSLAESEQRDSLGHPAAQHLHKAWARYGSEIVTNRTLRDWLRLDFFKDVHKGMYENRPIHWPLSSASKTFVAWVNIHRMDGQTLRLLLADHLIDGSLKRIEGEIDVLRSSKEGADAKAAQLATKRLNYLLQVRDELNSFIKAVQECADQGPPPSDARCPQRIQDAVYDPDLDDGVMINSAALWPLLEPQWKEPKKWWKELANAASSKDYDWAHLAMRYWPTRVDQKCQDDPSLGVAHGCFWRYHPARAWVWELRLQDEISPDFKIEEAPYRPGGRELGDAGDGPHRAAWLADHPEEALAAVEKEAIRRMGRGNNRKLVGEMTILEPGLWSALPKQVWDMELRLGERQGSEFCLIAPDEAEAREQLLAAHPHLATDRRAFLQGLAPQGELAVVLEDNETQEELDEIE